MYDLKGLITRNVQSCEICKPYLKLFKSYGKGLKFLDMKDKGHGQGH